jgi:hypothetical protein
MFVIIQIPFVDFRLLKKEEEEEKTFFFPHQFIKRAKGRICYRYFGFSKGRYNSDDLHPSEQNFFDSQKLLKIKYNSEDKYKYKLIFARLFADDFFFHFDIGIRIQFKNATDKIDLSSLGQNLFDKNIFVPSKQNRAGGPFNIFSLRQYIESLYLYATTHTKSLHCINANHLYLGFGKIAVFCQCRNNENIKENISLKKIIDDEDIYLQKATLRYSSDATHLWLIGAYNPEGETKDFLRRLRICLLKLNNYREGLDGIFKYLLHDDINFNDLHDLLYAKLNNLLKLLKQKKYYGIEGQYIMDRAVTIENEVYSGSWNEYKQKIIFYRNKIKRKSNGYIDYDRLLMEVEKLKEELRILKKSDGIDVLIEEMAQLRKAIEKKDNNKIIRSCGKQLLDTATNYGFSQLAGIAFTQLRTVLGA